MNLLQICYELGCPIRQHRSEKSQYREALSKFWEAPTLREEIWAYIHVAHDPTITIPMYLHYIQGWSRLMMMAELEITTPTFYKWITEPQIPIRHKGVLIEAMQSLTLPVDEDLYEEAMENEDQWRVKGHARAYQPSKRLAKKLDGDMKRNGVVRVKEYEGQNRLRLGYEIAHHAQRKGWVQTIPGVYHEREKRPFKMKTMAD